MFGEAWAALSLYCQGFRPWPGQAFKNCALINLHLATGKIGRPGAGAVLAHRPAQRDGRTRGRRHGEPAIGPSGLSRTNQAKVAALWGIDSVPARPGKTAWRSSRRSGAARSRRYGCAPTPQSSRLPPPYRKALERAELVVVVRAFRDAETRDYADVLLPAATWARRMARSLTPSGASRARGAAVAPPGEARPDWKTRSDFASRLRPRWTSSFSIDHETAEAIVFNEHRERTRGRDLDITGLYALLEREGPQQWPYPQGAKMGHIRLYADGVFPTSFRPRAPSPSPTTRRPRQARRRPSVA